MTTEEPHKTEAHDEPAESESSEDAHAGHADEQTAPLAPKGLAAPEPEGNALPSEEPDGVPLEHHEELIAPDVPRMLAPAYSAKKVIDPSHGGGPAASFLAAVSVLSLVSDIGTKLWAEAHLNPYKGGAPMEIMKDHITLMYAENKGGAWGLLQATREDVRRPFFLLVSVAAIAFIVTLYRRLNPRQRALKWGLPLVLGGALGNVFDRIRYGFVVDFIDFQSDVIKKGNELLAKYNPGHQVTNHWPTFNIADVAICVGVALMAVDMFTSKRGPKKRAADDVLAAGVDAEISTAPASHQPHEHEPHEPHEAGEGAHPADELPPTTEEAVAGDR